MAHKEQVLNLLQTGAKWGKGNWAYQEIAESLRIPVASTRRIINELRVDKKVIQVGTFEGLKLFEAIS